MILVNGECVCDKGFYMSNDKNSSKCEPCDNSCLSCSGPGLKGCTKCKELNNYFVDKTTGLCTINCSRGFYIEISTQTCKPCHPTCESCFDGTETSCYSCFE